MILGVFFFVICQYKKEVRNGYKGGGLVEAIFFFAKYNFNSSYIFIFKKSYFPILFLSKVTWHPALSPSYSECIFFKTFFTVSKPKATNSRVSDCYLTQTRQFSAISWREQVNFQWDDVCFVLDQDA